MKTLSTYDLYHYKHGSVVGRKNIEIERAKEFAQRVKQGENPHDLGVWSALTNKTKCGGIKSKRARAIAQSALHQTGWVFALDNYGHAALIRQKDIDKSVSFGISIQQAGVRFPGGWKEFFNR